MFESKRVDDVSEIKTTVSQKQKQQQKTNSKPETQKKEDIKQTLNKAKDEDD